MISIVSLLFHLYECNISRGDFTQKNKVARRYEFQVRVATTTPLASAANEGDISEI